MKILSFGAGMQSTALALMSCENAIRKTNPYPLVPIYDAVIFCDLGLEPTWVKEQMEFTRRSCESAGIFFKVLETPLYHDFVQNFGERRTVSIPWWTLRSDGHKSKMPRNCTIDYKVNEISKYVRCAFCPFHRNYFFQYLKENDNEVYNAVIGIDNLLRDKNPRPPMDSDLFISRSRKRILDLTPDDCNDAEHFEYCGKKMWNGF